MTGLSFCLLLAGLGEPRAPSPEPTSVPVYTNADLDRVSPLRGQTGALSEPALPAATATPPTMPGDRTNESARRARDEAYWRREAARVREKVAALQDQAAELRARLDTLAQKRRSSSSSEGRSGADSSTALERRLTRLTSRMRALEEDLADRARRANALPGWLR